MKSVVPDADGVAQDAVTSRTSGFSIRLMSSAQEFKGDLITVACPICGSDIHSHERTVSGFAFVRCRQCSLVYVNPQPKADALDRIYREKSDPQQVIDVYARLATPKVLAEYGRKLSDLEQMLGRTGRLLDFACAAGYFLEHAQVRGWDAHGVDLGPWAAKAAELRGVRNLQIGHLHDLAFPAHHFDVIYAAQVLEHLQNPLQTLYELRRILRPGGILYVDVPNYQTLPTLVEKNDFYLNSPPQHINFFTPRTLRALLERAGFPVVQMTSEGGLLWESLLGRPIRSDIADAYRVRSAQVQQPASSAVQRVGARLKEFVRPIASIALYRWAKLGINLVALSRRGDD